ncbi:hypothetical protein HHK36_033176 [Tetracentron sinense]|uniref:Early nodulin-93-like n=1 Tax=Tetracentron sinense TaxID=13715 RepID=A0A834Y3U4_TETSI|nr:hypothetical protein HHK36_033176 [Tetracentron sinense]
MQSSKTHQCLYLSNSNSISSVTFLSFSFPTMAKNVAQSPLERNGLASLDQKLALAKRCSHEGVVAGAKAAVVATIATAIPTFASVRMLPWARANLNHTAQLYNFLSGWCCILHSCRQDCFGIGTEKFLQARCPL